MTLSYSAATSVAARRSLALVDLELSLAGSTSSTARALLTAARPKPWVKNVLVLAAPVAGGALTSASGVAHMLAAAAIFCVVSSCIYLVNDITDCEADRLHPRKRFRPIAAGTLSPRTALAAAVAGIVAATVGALAIEPITFVMTLAFYVILTVSYSLWLKHQPVVDMVAVAAGFVARALAGAAAVVIAPSTLLLATVAFGSLFMVAGKRLAERRELLGAASAHRATLRGYSTRFLGSLVSVGGGGAAILYTLWAIQPQANHLMWLLAPTALPFIAGILRYKVILATGRGGAPEEIVLQDRILQLSAISLGVLVLAGIYLPLL
jgi:decaprenyl-phosphate phosphoribosyltransferase